MNPTITVDQVMNVFENGENTMYVRITIHIPRKDGESIRHGTFKVGEIISVPINE